MQVTENKNYVKLNIGPEEFIQRLETLVSKFNGQTIKINRNNGNIELYIKFPSCYAMIKIVQKEDEYYIEIKDETDEVENFKKELLKLNSEYG